MFPTCVSNPMEYLLQIVCIFFITTQNKTFCVKNVCIKYHFTHFGYVYIFFLSINFNFNTNICNKFAHFSLKLYANLSKFILNNISPIQFVNLPI